MTEENKLYFADCLKVLKKIHRENPQGIFDLVYIDPPFNSKRNYNVLFESIDQIDTTAQKEAFKDTWSNISYIDTINDIQSLSLDLYDYLKVLDKINISQSAVSYLAIMTIRLYYIHKVLKDTGSFYLHCDPNMSHYLKVICDLIFGYNNFRNEIAWCYKERELSKKQWNRKHDIIFLYAKNEGKQVFNYKEVLEPYSKITAKKFKYQDKKGYYQIRGKGIKGSPVYKADGLRPEHEKKYPDLTYRQYMQGGTLPRDWWNISIVNKAAKERLGYPTQKPEALLEKIIKASSNEGDLVGDFFCGCGTTIAVSEKLKRRWLGVDISHLAIGLIRKRLTAPHTKQKQKKILADIEINGFPLDMASAKELAQNVDKGRLLFQDWIIEVMLHGVSNPKKTGDGGFDGYISFTLNKEKQLILIEVKSGKLGVKNIREFIQVVEKREAAIGVFVCFSEYVTRGMEKEAKECGYYDEELFNKRHPKIQILTVEQILKGESINMPLVLETTFKEAAKAKLKPDGQQKSF